MKKQHFWAKGYNQRQEDKQRDKSKRQATKNRKKQPEENRKGVLKGMRQNDHQIKNLTQEVKDAQLEAKVYWQGLTAERKLTAAQRVQIQALQRQLKNLTKVEGLLALIAFFIGIVVGLVMFLVA
jgi:hypothetical protein